jgi:hypothetical protein
MQLRMSAAGTDEQFSLNIGFRLSTWIELSLPDRAPLLIDARKDTEASRTIASRARCIDSALRHGRIGSILNREKQYIRTRHSVFGGTGFVEHITGRPFLILESAAFSEIVFGSAKRQYRRREESRIWSHF